MKVERRFVLKWSTTISVPSFIVKTMKMSHEAFPIKPLVEERPYNKGVSWFSFSSKKILLFKVKGEVR